MSFITHYPTSETFAGNNKVHVEDSGIIVMEPGADCLYLIDMFETNSIDGYISMTVSAIENATIQFFYANWYDTALNETFQYLSQGPYRTPVHDMLVQRGRSDRLPIFTLKPTDTNYQPDGVFSVNAQSLHHLSLKFPPCRFIWTRFVNTSTEINRVLAHYLCV